MSIGVAGNFLSDSENNVLNRSGEIPIYMAKHKMVNLVVVLPLFICPVVFQLFAS